MPNFTSAIDFWHSTFALPKKKKNFFYESDQCFCIFYQIYVFNIYEIFIKRKLSCQSQTHICAIKSLKAQFWENVNFSVVSLGLNIFFIVNSGQLQMFITVIAHLKLQVENMIYFNVWFCDGYQGFGQQLLELLPYSTKAAGFLLTLDLSVRN